MTDLLTWQARRIRLDVDVDTVTVAHLSNGHPVNGVLPDPMVAYRAGRHLRDQAKPALEVASDICEIFGCVGHARIVP